MTRFSFTIPVEAIPAEVMTAKFNEIALCYIRIYGLTHDIIAPEDRGPHRCIYELEVFRDVIRLTVELGGAEEMRFDRLINGVQIEEVAP